ncbi:MAG: glycosyltransferase [Phycisphaerales bacterium]
MSPSDTADPAPSLASTVPGRVADALVLCMTRGMSLFAWESSGVLGREWALYERLTRHYARVIVVSYAADPREQKLAEGLGASAIFNRTGATIDEYTRALPSLVKACLAALELQTAVVKTNQFEGGAQAAAIARTLRTQGVPTALIARGGYPWSRTEARKHGTASPRALNAAVEEGDLLRAANLIIGTTDRMIEELAWRHGLAESSFRVVPNYVLSGPATTADQAAPAPSARPVVLAAGRLSNEKRYDMLVHAFATSGIEHRATLRIVGEGPLRGFLEAQARRECVNLELPGQLPHRQLLEEMERCALFVQCSQFEGHPKTVLEAMGRGACVLVTDTPGLGDVIDHAKTGWKTPHDSDRLDKAIAHLFNDPELRRKLGEQARAHIAATLNIETIAAREAALHAEAFARSLQPGATPALGPVRWDPSLLHAQLPNQTEAWRASLNGFARRLPPKQRARFLLSLDDPIYQLQGPAAIDAEGLSGGPGAVGVHPKHRLMRYHDFFVERINAGERAVDLGSGIGALAASIAARAGQGRGASVVGVEMSEQSIATARSIAAAQKLEHRLTYTLGDITTLRAAAPDGTTAFDAVILSNVLEHIKNRPAMLRQWAQWYTPKRFLIRVPAFDRDWKVPYKKELGVEWRLDDTHELEYTEGTLRAELEQAGLEITEWVVRWGEYWIVARATPTTQQWADIRLLVFDFDGVMSNNQVLVMQDGTEGVLCNRSDGLGVESLRKRAAAVRPPLEPAFSMLVLSKEVNPVVAARCKKLKLECHQGVDDKLPALQRLATDRGITREQIAYVGNDTNDVACMGWVGLPIAVADAYPECKAAARFVTQSHGGQGAVREVCDRLAAALAATEPRP